MYPFRCQEVSLYTVGMRIWVFFSLWSRVIELYIKSYQHWDFLGVRWLRLRLPKPRGVGLIPGEGAEIPRASWPKYRNMKQKQYCNKLSEDSKNGPYKKPYFEEHYGHFLAPPTLMNHMGDGSWTPPAFTFWSLPPACPWPPTSLCGKQRSSRSEAGHSRGRCPRRSEQPGRHRSSAPGPLWPAGSCWWMWPPAAVCSFSDASAGGLKILWPLQWKNTTVGQKSRRTPTSHRNIMSKE